MDVLTPFDTLVSEVFAGKCILSFSHNGVYAAWAVRHILD